MALSLKDKVIANVDLLDGIDSTGFLAAETLSDTAYGAGWSADTTHAPTKNAIYGILGTPLSGTKVYYVADTSGGATTRKLTFVNGILTSET